MKRELISYVLQEFLTIDSNPITRLSNKLFGNNNIKIYQ